MGDWVTGAGLVLTLLGALILSARDLNLGRYVRAPKPSYETLKEGFPRREAKWGFPLIALGTILQLVGLALS